MSCDHLAVSYYIQLVQMIDCVKLKKQNVFKANFIASNTFYYD